MDAPGSSFFDLDAHGFVRVALGVPRVVLADPLANAREIAELHTEALERGAALTLFPELSLSGYALDDLHQQDALLEAVLAGLDHLRQASSATSGLLAVGAPLRFDQRLFNCAVVFSRGKLLGVVPKTYLPDYREFYEKRQFAGARDAYSRDVRLLGESVPFGNDLIFRDEERADFAVHLELCEDLWTPIPPSTYAAFAGATLLGNLSASNVTIGKADYRRELAASQSAKTLSAYLYSAAGAGESTTDLAWDGHAMVFENGALLAESERFAAGGRLLCADVDPELLAQERSRLSSFIDCAAAHRQRAQVRNVPFQWTPRASVALERHVAREPYVPSDRARRDERCFEAYNIQVAGLEQRLRSSGIEKLVIGVSGGLDSTHALLVCVRAMDRLGLPRENVLAYTLPGFATSEATKQNAWDLMRALGVQAEEIDIRPSSQQMLADIEHPAAQGEAQYDVTYENVQAGERTNHLFRLANRHGALVVGTGDLSELALGWCTYGVGDHMSHYAVNVSVPKTLVRHLVGWVAEQHADEACRDVLERILATPITPELVPPREGDDGPQDTEAQIGPYELHDFFLYHVTRRGLRPSKVAFLAIQAWCRDVPGGPSAAYEPEQVFDWLEVFLTRFFRTSQFKRSAIPNGPKVGSGGSLSPRGDWRAPSDAGAEPWLADLARARAWHARGN